MQKEEKPICFPELSIAIVDDNPISGEITALALKDKLAYSLYVGNHANRNFLKDFEQTPGRFRGAILDAELHADDIPISATIKELRKLYVRFFILTATRPTDKVIKEEYDNATVVLRNDSNAVKDAIKLMVFGVRRSMDVTYELFEYRGSAPIGKGGFGEVWWIKNKENQLDYAMKLVKIQTILNNEKAIKQAMDEKEFLLRAKHKRVVPLISSFKTSATICFVFPLAPWGDLLNYLSILQVNRVGEDVARGIVSQVVEAVDFIHSQSICHRDIKLENILVCTNGDIQLCDFGCASLFGTKIVIQGHPETLPPEIIQQKILTPSINEYISRPQHDWWEVGVLAHELLVGRSPFDGNDCRTFMEQIYLGYQNDLPEGIKHLENVMKSILAQKDERNTIRRNGCYELSKETKHPPLYPTIDIPSCPKDIVEFPGACGLDKFEPVD